MKVIDTVFLSEVLLAVHQSSLPTDVLGEDGQRLLHRCNVMGLGNM